MTELDIAYSFNPNNHNNYQNFNINANNNSNNNDDNDDNDDDNNSNNNRQIIENKELINNNKEILIQQQPQYQQAIVPNNYYEEKEYKIPVKKNQRNPEYSFWDRMVLSKNDVLKLVILSLIIVLGISIEKFLFHYINQYLTENLLSPMQDFLVRLSIPVSVILFLWIIKSL